MADPIAWQKPHPLHSGLVRARGWRWSVTGWAEHGGLTAARLAPREPEAPDLETVLLPADRLVAVPTAGWRRASRAWLRRWVEGWPRTAWPHAPLCSPIDAPADIVAHQLVPALVLTDGGSGTRLLLADPVGRGKTVEAGLVIAELARRRAADRVLVLTPAALRAQWRSELDRHCGVTAVAVDRAVLASLDRESSPGAGAFRAPGVAVLSTDLAKQPGVLARLLQVCWDVLVVDEAHGVGGDSARTAAVGEIASRSRVVLLLSATPHAGARESFARLCRLGASETDPPIVVVSAPPDGSLRPRRHLDVAPRLSPAERGASSALDVYLRALEGARAPVGALVALVLRKRALSSPAALARSLEHRLGCLDLGPAALRAPSLPLEPEEADDGDAAQPEVLGARVAGLRLDERAALVAALDQARLASGAWCKLAPLLRLLRRTREQVLVFTEYRDTLTAMAGALAPLASIERLHGGLDPASRERAVDAFTRGDARVLLATDVAAEGLNLQRRCRLVVHVELPWSPARLEQRNGRVDRRGQRRRVHIWRLLGEAGHESRTLARRAARARRMAADGIDTRSLGLPAGDDEADAGPPVAVHAIAGAGWDRAASVADLLTRMRGVLRHARRPPAARPRPERAALRWCHLRRWPGGLPPGVTVVLLWPSGPVGTCPSLLPVHVALTRWPAGSPSSWLPGVAAAAAAACRQATPDRGAGLVGALRRREEGLAGRALADQHAAHARWQPSLFERRTARLVNAARSEAAARVDAHRQRLSELDEAGDAVELIPAAALLVR